MLSITVLLCLVVFPCSFSYSDFSSILKSSDFIEIRQSNFFIDKTLLIYKTADNEEPILFTAPQGFGKSTNLDMIRVFFSNAIDYKVAQEMFADTEISKDSHFVKTRLGNNPVIHCSFELALPVTDFNEMVTSFGTLLHKVFLQHHYLGNSTLLDKSDLDQFKKFVDANSYKNLAPSDLTSGLHFLSKILKSHHGKPVILLIDDYDSVIWDSVLTKGLGIQEVLGFYDAVLNKVVTDKENVKKSILTGTSCTLLKLLPGLQNIKCVKFLHDRNFQPYFGLTGDDVDCLVDKTVFVSLRPNLTEWYGGYSSPDLSTHVYNTRSLMSFLLLSQGHLKSFWKTPKIQNSLRILLEDSVRKSLLLDTPETLMFVVRELTDINRGVLEGVKSMIHQEIWDANVSDFYIHMLMEQGYFTFDKPWERSGYNSSVTLKLANLDICGCLQKFIIDFTQELKRQSANLNIV